MTDVRATEKTAAVPMYRGFLTSGPLILRTVKWFWNVYSNNEKIIFYKSNHKQSVIYACNSYDDGND